MKKSLFLFFSLALLQADFSMAKSSSFGGRSSSSFSSSRSSYSSSRSSYSSPSRSSSSFGGRSSSSSGGSSSWFSSSRPSSSSSRPSSDPIQVDRKSYLSGLSKKGATGNDAGALYKSFRQNNVPPTRFDRDEINRMFKPDYRQERRRNYYQDYQPNHGTHYASYMNSHSGGFGIWDYMMFSSILDNLGDRQMYYHHHDDPGFKQWRSEADKACIDGDKDVCEKLKDLDKEMAEYRSKGVTVDPHYITPGVDPDIYEANQIDMSKLPAIKVCTGSIGADYNRYLSEIEKLTKIKTIKVESNGSVDNLKKMASGECDLGFAQDDLLVSEHIKKLATLNKMEVGFLICHKDAGINKVSDLSDKQTVYIGSDQTGSQFTFNHLKTVVEYLQKPKVNTGLSVMGAVAKMNDEPNSCLWGVSTPKFAAFTGLDESGKFVGVPIYSWDFKNKKPSLYELVTIDVDYYKNLTPDDRKKYGLFTKGGTDSIGVKTDLFATDTWIEQNKQLYQLLLLERGNLVKGLN